MAEQTPYPLPTTHTHQELSAIVGKALFGEDAPSREYATDWDSIDAVRDAAEAKYGVSIDYVYPPGDFFFEMNAYANNALVTCASSNTYVAALCFLVEELEHMAATSRLPK